MEENLSELRLAKLTNSMVLRIFKMTPKPRLSEFVLRFGTRRSVLIRLPLSGRLFPPRGAVFHVESQQRGKSNGGCSG